MDILIEAQGQRIWDVLGFQGIDGESNKEKDQSIQPLQWWRIYF